MKLQLLQQQDMKDANGSCANSVQRHKSTIISQTKGSKIIEKENSLKYYRALTQDKNLNAQFTALIGAPTIESGANSSDAAMSLIKNIMRLPNHRRKLQLESESMSNDRKLVKIERAKEIVQEMQRYEIGQNKHN